MRNKYYFAYGSNLNTGDWQRWCRKRGFAEDMLRFRSVGYLPDQDIVFNYGSESRKGGVLNLVRRLGQLVEGVIFKVRGNGWEALDDKEGTPNRYKQLDTVAIDDDGKEVDVTTYYVPKERTEGFVEPHGDYVDVVRRGLQDYKLSDGALNLASCGKRPDWTVDAFFVYGTLLRNETRFRILRQFGLECTLLAQTHGRLHDFGNYPGLVEASNEAEFVQGDFIRLRNPGGAISKLDRIEGFTGFGKPGSLFQRALIQVDVGEGRIRQAWTYRYANSAPTAPTIPSGDWREHRGCRYEFLQRLVQVHAGDDEARIAAGIARGIPYSFNPDHDAVVRSLLPLTDSLLDHQISERKLAQISGSWVTVP